MFTRTPKCAHSHVVNRAICTIAAFDEFMAIDESPLLQICEDIEAMRKMLPDVFRACECRVNVRKQIN